MTDFSTQNAKALFNAEVERRMEILGCSRDQAEMLVAALMWEKGPDTLHCKDKGS